MVSIISPAMRFTHLPYLVKKLIIASVAAEEAPASTSKGKPMPIPKNKKRNTFSTKSTVATALAKRMAINPGLHGTTIAPKKKPYKKAVTQGFLAMGARPFGRNLQMSASILETSDRIPVMISIRLIISSMPKAIGETIWTTLVNDTCRTVVNTNPSKNMNKITPEVITTPNKKIVFLPTSPLEIWLER